MALNFSDLKVLVREGGEMASGIAHRLHHCHMRVFITEVAVAHPLFCKTIDLSQLRVKKSHRKSKLLDLSLHFRWARGPFGRLDPVVMREIERMRREKGSASPAENHRPIGSFGSVRARDQGNLWRWPRAVFLCDR